MSRNTLLLLSLILLVLPACAKKQAALPPPHELKPRTAKRIHSGPGTTRATDVKKRLDNAYREWVGVPHRDGGLSKKGIDCSGFVHLVFKDKFAQKVPRTTASLAKTGIQINQRQLQPGDLVLFKIRWGVNHVGIYTGDGTFIHASKSKGVWRSKLGLKYWQDHYWQSRRVLK
jgi:cell wall-associated NlpC family hydrolase